MTGYPAYKASGAPMSDLRRAVVSHAAALACIIRYVCVVAP